MRSELWGLVHMNHRSTMFPTYTTSIHPSLPPSLPPSIHPSIYRRCTHVDAETILCSPSHRHCRKIKLPMVCVGRIKQPNLAAVQVNKVSTYFGEGFDTKWSPLIYPLSPC